MCGDMQDSARSSALPEYARGSLLAEEEFGLRKECRYGLHLGQDMRSALIGDSQDNGVCGITRDLVLAKRKHSRAWCIGDGVNIAKVLAIISKRMKGEIVERAMAHKDQVLCAEVRVQRRDELGIECFQMT